MKFKRLILGLGVGASVLAGCNDELSSVGTSIQPSDDTIAVYTDTFRVEATTVLLDSIYARTTSAELGELYDPLYGNVKSDYLCQFYCPDGYQFEHTPYGGTIDSVEFKIYYAGATNGVWVGDSLAPMRAEIFRVTSPLEKHFYTNADPADFCDMSQSLGSRAYTAYDPSIPDSVRESTSYSPHVTIEMPREFGQSFYEETLSHPEHFDGQEAFNQYFPGLYVTNTFGSGNILSVSSSVMSIYYKYAEKDQAGQDSLVNWWESFNVTKEVIQLSRFKNTDMEQLLEPNDQYTYMKTPAGVTTRLTIPIKEMAATLQGRIINNLPLTLKAMPQGQWEYALEPPTYLLALPEDSVASFFEGAQIPNSVTSFLSEEYDPDSRTYEFPNLATLLSHQLETDPDHDLNLLIVPVTRSTSYDYYGNEVVSAINNYMAPAGVKLRKDDDVMRISITSSKYAR